MYCLIPGEDGNTFIHLINYYGITGARSNNHQKKRGERPKVRGGEQKSGGAWQSAHAPIIFRIVACVFVFALRAAAARIFFFLLSSTRPAPPARAPF